jgi:2-succinyl-5-enolpyruvyl-6-hydroxy-3-cyclohexene-1-carboxylate synthase
MDRDTLEIAQLDGRHRGPLKMGSAWPAEEALRLGEWARLLFGTLAASGVSEVFISPGSRSTPFAWLALQTPGLRCHSIVDERCAAFAALGVARAVGRPAALLCTSGSAAANYYPAIVEAALACVPLLVITADRPFEAQHSSAAQCIDQVKLYGDHVRRYFELGLPDAAPAALVGLRRAITQAVALAQHPVPGPVHLNARARKPLEPPAQMHGESESLHLRVSALLATPVSRRVPALATPSQDALRELARHLAGARAGVIVAGPLPTHDPILAMQVGALASALRFPIMAEATSQMRFALADHPLACGEFAWLFGDSSSRRRFAADVILSLGATPACRDLELWATESGAARFVLGEREGPDPEGNALLTVHGDLVLSLTRLRQKLIDIEHEPGGPQRGFAAALQARGRRCRSLIAEELAVDPVRDRRARMAEGAAVDCVARALPRGAQWMLGNSLALREVDAYVTHAADTVTLSQRGANGIDGLVSGAVGSALAAERPTLLLLGDVSLLHDLGGLALARLVKTPLVLAVIDNDGGRIFDQLPVRELYAGDDQGHAHFWVTPGGLDLAHAAALFGMAYAAPTTLEALASATTEALQRPGTTLLQIRVAPDSAREVRERVLLRLATESTGLPA